MYDRKTWVILTVCGALLVANLYFNSKNQQIKQREQAAEQVQKESKTTVREVTGETTAGLTVEPPPPPTEEELVTLETDEITFTLTNIGGGIKYAEFREEFAVGSTTVPVRVNSGQSGGPIGALAGAGKALENVAYTYKKDESEEGKSAVFIAKHPSGLVVKKTFSIAAGGEAGAAYLLDLDIQIENSTAAPVDLGNWSLYLGDAAPLYQKEVPQQTGFFWHEDGGMHFESVTGFKGGWFSSEKSILTSPGDATIEYAGVTNQFFATVFRLEKPAATSVWAKPDKVALKDGAKPLASVRAGMKLPGGVIEPGGRQTVDGRIFIGPKHNTMLRKMDSKWGEGWGDVMQYGWFSPVSRTLNWLLNTYHGWIDHIAKNWAWGLAIIFLTITVRLAIWPLHAKSTHTMKRMSMLKPKMDELKEKYGDDPNKLNTEMMGLYRKYGINPLGGCLPMFIQIPIFFGFYRMLQYAVELRGEGFLWVDDLSQPDTLAHVAGIPINLLPIVMAGTSFLQIHLTPKTGDKTQQRIMMFMPFMFFFFCYNFASALALYWTTQNIFSILQTWLMSKVPEPELKPVKGAKKSWAQKLAERQAEIQKAQKNRQSGMPGGPMRDVTPDKKKPRPPRTGG
ncbi:MAG: membrane protein insertase YidC [Verrucomicrobiae bacterium]|nr:membrane protein insertase YidC [Verrucomicrobiae bacterium]MCP5534160.1 membrane protein insertase YidC [Akkermansiaceae bacterium]MCP5543784.1 membrane protein insertase YidC [Akkermansiaceae bacterium]MCP5546547.1 membrane protein insertase YidC [Akkermansiaceae bacterium]